LELGQHRRARSYAAAAVLGAFHIGPKVPEGCEEGGRRSASSHVKIDPAAADQRQRRSQWLAGKARRLTRQYAEGVAGHAGGAAESITGPRKACQRGRRTTGRSQDALPLPSQCHSLNRELTPAAWIGLNHERLWVAGAAILAEQRCLRHER